MVVDSNSTLSSFFLKNNIIHNGYSKINHGRGIGISQCLVAYKRKGWHWVGVVGASHSHRILKLHINSRNFKKNKEKVSIFINN